MNSLLSTYGNPPFSSGEMMMLDQAEGGGDHEVIVLLKAVDS